MTPIEEQMLRNQQSIMVELMFISKSDNRINSSCIEEDIIKTNKLFPKESKEESEECCKMPPRDETIKTNMPMDFVLSKDEVKKE